MSSEDPLATQNKGPNSAFSSVKMLSSALTAFRVIIHVSSNSRQDYRSLMLS